MARRIAASASGEEPGRTLGFDAREQPAFGGLEGEIAQGVLAGHVVGQEALDRPHGPARVGGALGDLLGVDAAVEDRQLVLELAPALPEDGVHLPFDLLRGEHADEAHVVQLRPAAGIVERGRHAVGAVEIGDDPVLEDVLEVEAGPGEALGDGLDLAALLLVRPAPGGVERVVQVLGRRQDLAAREDVIDVLDHGDREAGVLRGPLAEPLQRPPALLGLQLLPLEAGGEHVLVPAPLAAAVDPVEAVIILEQAGHGIDRLVADHAFRRLHRRDRDTSP